VQSFRGNHSLLDLHSFTFYTVLSIMTTRIWAEAAHFSSFLRIANRSPRDKSAENHLFLSLGWTPPLPPELRVQQLPQNPFVTFTCLSRIPSDGDSHPIPTHQDPSISEPGSPLVCPNPPCDPRSSTFRRRHSSSPFSRPCSFSL